MKTLSPADAHFAQIVLGHPLVPSDSHDDEEGALMTQNQEWYFVPHHDDPVVSRPTIGHPNGKPTDRPRWGVEIVKVFTSYAEPDDYDLAEIKRADSLWEAIKAARHYALDRELADHAYATWSKFDDPTL